MLRVGDEDVILVRGTPVWSVTKGDLVGRAATITAMLLTHVSADEIERLLQVSHGTVWNVKDRYASGGMEAVLTFGRAGRPGLMNGAKRKQLKELRAKGLTLEQCAAKLRVSKSLIGNVVKKYGFGKAAPVAVQTQLAVDMPVDTEHEASIEQPSLETPRSAVTPSEPSSSPEPSVHQEIKNAVSAADSEFETPVKQGDMETQLDDATAASNSSHAAELLPGAQLVSSPVEHASRYAGVLLVCAALIVIGVSRALDAAHVVRPKTAVYNAHQVLVSLLAAWGAGYRSIESMHERDAHALGVILGLERSPSVRTLHRAIVQMIVGFDPILLRAQLMHEMTSVSLPEPPKAPELPKLRWFGVDGHFKVYSGTAPIDKGWNSKQRLACKGLHDVVITDERGRIWDAIPVGAADALSQHTTQAALSLRKQLGVEVPFVLGFDRGGFKFDVLNTLAADSFSYAGYVPASVSLPDLATIAPDNVDTGETIWVHSRLRHPARLIVVRDGNRRIPIVTNLTTAVDADQVVRGLRSVRGVEENAFKAAREYAQIDRLVDRGVAETRPDDRLVRNSVRTKLLCELRQTRAAVERLRNEHAKRGAQRKRAHINRELREAQAKEEVLASEVKKAPAKVPRVQLEPEAKRALLKTKNRLLLQPLKYAMENARRWLLGNLATALAPTDHSYDDDAIARTLQALVRAPGTVRFGDDEVVVTLDLQLPPSAHQRLVAGLEALDAFELHFTDRKRRVRFRLAPRTMRRDIATVLSSGK